MLQINLVFPVKSSLSVREREEEREDKSLPFPTHCGALCSQEGILSPHQPGSP